MISMEKKKKKKKGRERAKVEERCRGKLDILPPFSILNS
jgi:hypothetical protein